MGVLVLNCPELSVPQAQGQRLLGWARREIPLVIKKKRVRWVCVGGYVSIYIFNEKKMPN